MRTSKHTSLLSVSLALSAALFSVAPAHAAVYTEIGDAGDLPASAQVLYAHDAHTALTSISGNLTISNNISEADMFEIFISDPSTFSASTTGFAPGVNGFDTQLFLFTLGGLGVLANDDDPLTGNPQSNIPAGSLALPSNYYYLLITGAGHSPISAGGLIFPNYTDGVTDPTGVYGPSGAGGAKPITGYTGNSSEGGKYKIALTGAEFLMPEPSSLLIAASGLGLLVRLRRRRCSAAV